MSCPEAACAGPSAGVPSGLTGGLTGGSVAISLSGVSKRFSSALPGSPPALDTLNALIPAGCMVGLVGPDAAGKTTLMRLLAGLLKPSRGTIDVLGGAPGDSAEVGYMPQRFGLYEDISVIDNLNLHAELRGLENPERKTTFERLLGFTGLVPFTTRLAGKLSGGMKQKLGLACALLTTPRLLLLDEPGVGVDPLSRRELWHMVAGLTHNGISVIWSTSYMDEAERCAHVLMLEEGKLVYQGPPADFTRRVVGRVFYVSPPSDGRKGQDAVRPLLSALSAQAGVVDALIQGSKIRLVLEAPDSPLQGFAAAVREAAPPRLEDAYIDALGGMSRTPSPFADPAGYSSENRLPPDEPAIKAVGLTKRFGAFTAARDISFAVRPGHIFGLLGPNGAGKSTTFRMLCGLSRPSSGECHVAGINLLAAAGEARSRLGYMAQKFSLYGEITVFQNMRLVGELYNLPRRTLAARLERMLEALDLTAFRNTKANILPLGQRQRLSMACATLHSPPVLFLDEPTSGVDPRTRREFWKHINAMTQNGVAVLVTTHFMEEAEYCDEIALIHQGGVIAKGTPDALKNACPKAYLPELDAMAGPTMEDAFIAYIRATEEQPGGKPLAASTDA